jgi:hypothetical protein
MCFFSTVEEGPEPRRNHVVKLIAKSAVCIGLWAVASSYASAADYATCLLDKLPGVKNAPAHAAALNLCAQQHPDKFFEVRRGSGRGLLGPKSPEQCTLDARMRLPVHAERRPD